MKKITLCLFALALPHFAWGQLMFSTSMKGWNEVPPRESPAFGFGTATLDLETNLFTFNYTFEGLLGPQTGAHIHLAPSTGFGPILHHLPAGSPASFSRILTEQEISQLRGGEWYVNIHSTVYPGGEIRGQFVPVPEPSTYAMGGMLVLGAVVLVRRRLGRLRRIA